VSVELQSKVLEEGEQPLTCRPADKLAPELDKLTEQLRAEAKEKGLTLASGEREIDDVLTYSLFAQVGLKFIANRGNPDAFEPVPTGKESSKVLADNGDEVLRPLAAGLPVCLKAATR